jgi:hypothetical protein
MSSEAGTKKVKPYPIEARVPRGDKPIWGDIHRLERHGLVFDSKGEQFQINDQCQIEFVIPVLKHTVVVSAKVVKFYDKYVMSSDGDKKIERWYEFHFLGLLSEHHRKIDSFLKAIGQK